MSIEGIYNYKGLKNYFEKIDKNGDLKISTAELSAGKIKTLDKDGSKTVEIWEFMEAVNEQRRIEIFRRSDIEANKKAYGYLPAIAKILKEVGLSKEEMVILLKSAAQSPYLSYKLDTKEFKEMGLNKEEIRNLLKLVVRVETDSYHVYVLLPVTVESLKRAGLNKEEIMDLLKSIAQSAGENTNIAYCSLINELRGVELSKEMRDLLKAIAQISGKYTSWAYDRLKELKEAGVSNEEIVNIFKLIAQTIEESHTISAYVALPALMKAGLNKEETINLLKSVTQVGKENTDEACRYLAGAIRGLEEIGLSAKEMSDFLTSLAQAARKNIHMAYEYLPESIKGLKGIGLSKVEMMGFLRLVIQATGEGTGGAYSALPRILSIGITDLKEILNIIGKFASKSNGQSGLFLRELAVRLENEESFGNIMNDFETLWDLNITWISRFPSLEIRTEVVKNRQENKDDGHPLAVFIFPKADWNEVFNFPCSVIQRLHDRGYRIMYYEVNTDQEMYENLQTSTHQRKASVLIIGGHGSRTSTSFGTGFSELYTLDLSDEIEMKDKHISACLEDGGRIIFSSCNTGLGAEKRENMANLLKRIFPQASHIWAPQGTAGMRKLEFDSHGNVMGVQYGGDTPVYDAGQSKP